MCWETLVHLLAHMVYVISVVGEEREGRDTQVLNCQNLGVTHINAIHWSELIIWP